jgi:hypothetical protein
MRTILRTCEGDRADLGKARMGVSISRWRTSHSTRLLSPFGMFRGVGVRLHGGRPPNRPHGGALALRFVRQRRLPEGRSRMVRRRFLRGCGLSIEWTRPAVRYVDGHVDARVRVPALSSRGPRATKSAARWDRRSYFFACCSVVPGLCPAASLTLPNFQSGLTKFLSKSLIITGTRPPSPVA